METVTEWVVVPKNLFFQLTSLQFPLLAFDPDRTREEFELCCRVELRLAEGTIKNHMRHYDRFVRWLNGRHPLAVTRQDLRMFLLVDCANDAVKFLRVFYGKFLRSDLAKDFKIPESQRRVLILPTRKDLTITFQRLKRAEFKAAFLVLASSGLRIHELCELTPSQISFSDRMIIPQSRSRNTKNQWVTFYNPEAEVWLLRWLKQYKPAEDERVFPHSRFVYYKAFKRASQPTSTTITPQILRAWFAEEIGRLGVPDRYIDAFCGRVPKSVLARHYTDFSPHKLKEIYERAGLRVLEKAGREEWR